MSVNGSFLEAMTAEVYTVLYTHQKAKKAKVWQDGCLKTSGQQAVLYSDKGQRLESVYLKTGKVNPGDELESDRYLITVEGVGDNTSSTKSPAENKDVYNFSRISLKPMGLRLPIGLKRKFTGFQGPREITKKPSLEVEETSVLPGPQLTHGFSSQSPQLYAASPLFAAPYRKQPDKDKHANSFSEQTIETTANPYERENIFHNDFLASTENTKEGEITKQNPRSTAQILALLDTLPSQKASGDDLVCSHEVQRTASVQNSVGDAQPCNLPIQLPPVRCEPLKSRWDVYIDNTPASSTAQIDHVDFVTPLSPRKSLDISHTNPLMNSKARQEKVKSLDRETDMVDNKHLSKSQTSEPGLTKDQSLPPDSLASNADDCIIDYENHDGAFSEITFNLMDSFDLTELDDAESTESQPGSVSDSTRMCADLMEKQEKKNQEKHTENELLKNDYTQSAILHGNITDCDITAVSDLSCVKAESTIQTLLKSQSEMAKAGDNDHKPEVMIEATVIPTVECSLPNKAKMSHISFRQIMFQSDDVSKLKTLTKNLDDSLGKSRSLLPNANMHHSVQGSNKDCNTPELWASGRGILPLKSLTEPSSAIESLNVLCSRPEAITKNVGTEKVEEQGFLATVAKGSLSQREMPLASSEDYRAAPTVIAEPPFPPALTTPHCPVQHLVSPCSHQSGSRHSPSNFKGPSSHNCLPQWIVGTPGSDCDWELSQRSSSKSNKVKTPTQNLSKNVPRFFLRPGQGNVAENSAILLCDSIASLEQNYLLDSTKISKVQSRLMKELTAVSVAEEDVDNVACNTTKDLKPSSFLLSNGRSVVSSEVKSSKWTVYQSFSPGRSQDIKKENSDFCPQSVFRSQDRTDEILNSDLEPTALCHLAYLKDKPGSENCIDTESRNQIIAKIHTQTGHFQPLVGKKRLYSQDTKDEQIVLSCELGFPCRQTVLSSSVPKRKIKIPALFKSAAHYKQVSSACLAEHLNIIMYELSQRLHRAFSKVDMSFYTSNGDETQKKDNAAPLCLHQQPAKLVMVRKEGPNKGRFFYSCDAPKDSQCKFFKWLNEVKGTHIRRDTQESRLVMTDMKSLSGYIRCQNMNLYEESQLIIRKISTFPKRQFGKFQKFANVDSEFTGESKPKLYLKLSRKHSSSAYSKDDLWVVSKTLNFDPLDTFIAFSVFFGPSANNDIEISPLKGYSPSNWPSNMVVHALLVCNASTELTSLRNIHEHFNPSLLPIMPHLLTMSSECEKPIKIPRGKFKPPAMTAKVSSKCNIADHTFVLNLAKDMITQFCLNEDQATALVQIAHMMASSDTEGPQSAPITIIHGVFGAGKSYLLAVVVLFLVHLFETHNPPEEHDSFHWKLLISSSTNVAVDRVLLGLLNLGFDQFIRVGSIRKIAKPILPHSIHAGSENESEQLKELQALLREDLTPGEKAYVRKSIELHKLGTNKSLLGQVRVVGATCAACPFPCLSNLKFPVVILDECSQMTEPASLLPIARFQCEKLILVGDPKQLSPTIQGSEAAHEYGLEQTLFNRLCLMGHKAFMLRTQYRCHPSISAVANELFYEGNLLNGVSEEDRKPLLDWLPTLCFYNANGTEQVEGNNSFYNVEEANFTVKLIQSLIGSGVQGSMIGVITLYKSQMNKICCMLSFAAVSDPSHIKMVQVSTVDAFQGAEKEIIILSCVRTRQVGFIDSEKRMNVALTRGKRHLLIVGSLACLRKNKLWEQVIHHCERHKDGLNHVGQWDERLNAILALYQEKKEEVASSTQRNPNKTNSRKT
ncbi:protein ZGRF1 isoform X2 [Hyla sarda]|uniref:protein ZGRF1 isoform X2 n=1 Tax=Hyla sarda TaxID=327740 RepID=UPI0024C25709|nr:protein ZGRF1 isoform X2 [Hyla sarda]